jgi:uncharacterized membrane protein YphA (DoxX/SURF4 family)
LRRKHFDGKSIGNKQNKDSTIMKGFVNIARIIVGVLFIFSGLVKANDPVGLSYKMQEFFQVWGWQSLNDFTLPMSILMNVFEIVAGVAVLVGWRMKLFSWLLLLLIIFFTFLTGYAAYSGKFKSCGCFGDCIPLEPTQSFIKDIVLLLLILLIWYHRDKITSSIAAFKSFGIIAIATLAAFGMQWYVMKHLPIKDCLGFKPGANIVENMRIPQGAVPDSFAMTFIYNHNGKDEELDVNQLSKLDNTYKFVKRNQKLVRKGNADPKIHDFALSTLAGKDTTMEVLNTAKKYMLFFIKDFSRPEAEWKKGFDEVAAYAKANGITLMIVTADGDKAQFMFMQNIVLTCDATAIKTAARTSPMFMILQQGNVLNKFSYADADAAIAFLKKNL